MRFWAYNIPVMSLKDQIFLQLYAAQGDISGETLAKNLGVSRAAVWKAVNSLRADGYVISSGTNRGYKLLREGAETSDDAPDERSLSAELGIKVIRLACVDSTNAYALSLPDSSPALIVADRQTRGKARRGKVFESPDGGLYMSYLCFPKIPLSEIPLLNERAAAAVAEILNGERKEQEIYRSDKKIAGVLTEVPADPDGVNRAAIGIGIRSEGLIKPKTQLICEIIRQIK